MSYRQELRDQTLELGDSPSIAAALGRVRHELTSNPVVLGLPPPVSQAGCGSDLWAGNPGTAGPLAKRGATTGILTAGHVATSVGTVAYLDGNQWGSVTYTTNATQDPADIGYVERAAGATAGPRCPQPNGLIRPALGALVSSFGAITCESGNVLGIMPFQWFPALGRNLAEVMLTAQPISTHGDSGALVLDDASAAMVGLVVGGDRDAKTFSCVQLAGYSMPRAGCTL